MSCANNTCSDLIRVQLPAPVWADWLWRPLWLDHVRSLYDVLQMLRRVRERTRQRRALGELDDRLLADIGLTREQALRECRKWSWE